MSDDTFDDTPEAAPGKESWRMPEHEVLAHARDIVRRFKAMDLTLTLRQIYYQFVKGGLAPSSGDVYDRIGRILTKARYAGEFPVEDIEDRGRDVRPGKFKESSLDVHHALSRAGETIRWMPQWLIKTDRWVGQPVHVSVWIEKDALANVIEKPCDELGVSWFPCKGYPSVSALWEWLKAAREVERLARQRGFTTPRFVILYAGDHDPDGLEIPKSALRNLQKLQNVQGWALHITLKRIALNMDQIRRYDPPPFEAKMTSARYRKYVEAAGTDEAWELDALDPPVLQRLVRESVAPLFKADIHDANQEIVRERRKELVDLMADPDWLRGVVTLDDKEEDEEDDEEGEDDEESEDEEDDEELAHEDWLRDRFPTHEQLTAILTSISIQVYPHETYEDLFAAVVANLDDGTLTVEDVEDHLE